MTKLQVIAKLRDVKISEVESIKVQGLESNIRQFAVDIKQATTQNDLQVIEKGLKDLAKRYSTVSQKFSKHFEEVSELIKDITL